MPGITPQAAQPAGQPIGVGFELGKRSRCRTGVRPALATARHDHGHGVGHSSRGHAQAPGDVAPADAGALARVSGVANSVMMGNSRLRLYKFSSRRTSERRGFQHVPGDVDLQRSRHGLPTRHGVDFDHVQSTVGAGQQVDSGHRRSDRSPRLAAPGQPFRSVNSTGSARGAAADVGPPIERVAAAHGPHVDGQRPARAGRYPS